MPLDISLVTVENILTRTTGYLSDVTSHSVQPYRGCTFGNGLCGVGCYVQHNWHVTRGRAWGGFLEVRTNAADAYRARYARERRWTARRGISFSIFLSSATDPFLPQEARHGVTRSLLEAMCEFPPDELVVQTHSHQVIREIDHLARLAERCRVRVHVSIETDRERIDGLPPHVSSVAKRLEACRMLRDRGLRTVVTVSPLLPIENPDRFFERIAAAADAVVIDHFVGGDGSHDGSRTLRTALPRVIAAMHSGALGLDYRDEIVACARRQLPGRVGIHREGFAGRYA
jgi:DNA repair photolyase